MSRMPRPGKSYAKSYASLPTGVFVYLSIFHTLHDTRAPRCAGALRTVDAVSESCGRWQWQW